MAKRTTKTAAPAAASGDAAPVAGKRVYLLTGSDEFVVNKQARDLVSQLCPEGEASLGLEILDAQVDKIDEATPVLGQCLEGLQTMGFFGGQKVVWLRNATFLGGETPLARSEDVKRLVDRLTELIKKGLPDGTTLVVSAQEVDGRKAFFKACQSEGVLFKYEVTDPTKRGGGESIMAQIRMSWADEGMQPASHSVLQAFMDRVGTDTRQIAQETQKLRTYLGADADTVTEADVVAISSMSRESVGWDLADHVGARNLGRALTTLRQLLFQKESTIGMIIQIENRLRDMLILKECQRRRWLNISGPASYQQAEWNVDGEGQALLEQFGKDPRKMHPYRTVLLMKQAANYSLRELAYALDDVTRTHEGMVSSGLPQELALESFLIRTLAKPEKR